MKELTPEISAMLQECYDNLNAARDAVVTAEDALTAAKVDEQEKVDARFRLEEDMRVKHQYMGSDRDKLYLSLIKQQRYVEARNMAFVYACRGHPWGARLEAVGELIESQPE